MKILHKIISKMTEFEKFTHDRGGEFTTDETLQAGYDRHAKHKRGALITENEFIVEAGECYDIETLKAVYATLTKFVTEKKLDAAEVYKYARFGWCLRNPEAIVAYEESRDCWIVNNCFTQATEEKAVIEINAEWGFEASRIKIIGTPYYDASDYQFIRFDCVGTSWLWKNSSLYQVYNSK